MPPKAFRPATPRARRCRRPRGGSASRRPRQSRIQRVDADLVERPDESEPVTETPALGQARLASPVASQMPPTTSVTDGSAIEATASISRSKPFIRSSRPTAKTTRPSGASPRARRGSGAPTRSGAGPTPLGTTTPPTRPKRSRRSSSTSCEQPVVTVAAEIASRRPRRSSAEVPNASWSSMKVSPCDDSTRGTPVRRASAAAYSPLGPKHCTCSTSGRKVRLGRAPGAPRRPARPRRSGPAPRRCGRASGSAGGGRGCRRARWCRGARRGRPSTPRPRCRRRAARSRRGARATPPRRGGGGRTRRRGRRVRAPDDPSAPTRSRARCRLTLRCGCRPHDSQEPACPGSASPPPPRQCPWVPRPTSSTSSRVRRRPSRPSPRARTGRCVRSSCGRCARACPAPGACRWAGWRRPPRARAAAVGRVAYGRADLVHRMTLELPPAPREVVTLHDVVAWRYPDESPPVAAAAAELRRAAAVICVSEFTASEAVDLLGLESPVVVPNGVEQRFFDAAPLGRRRARGPRGDDALRARRRRSLRAQEPRRARRRLAARARRATRHDPRARRAAPPAAHRALRVAARACGWSGGCPTPCCRACMPPRPWSSCPRSSRGSVCRPSRAWRPGCRSSPPTGRRCRRSSATAGCSSSRWAPLWRKGSSTCWRVASDVAAMVARGRERSRRFTWEASAEGHARVWHSVV